MCPCVITTAINWYYNNMYNALWMHYNASVSHYENGLHRKWHPIDQSSVIHLLKKQQQQQQQTYAKFDWFSLAVVL